MKQSYFKFILALLLFGTNGIVASHISLTSYEIVFIRALLGSLLLIILFKAGGNKFDITKIKRDLIYVAVSGVAMGASWMLLYEAYRQIGVSIASLVYYCGPVLVMALSPLLFKERLTLPKVIGFSAVLGGIVLLNIQSAHDGKIGWGLLIGILSALMFALMTIFNKKARNITGMKNSVLQLTISFLTVAVFIGFRQGFVINISHSDWLPLLILGLLNTGVGCYLYFSSIDALPVQTVAVLGYLEPLSAVVFSVIFLKEILQPIQILGAVLVIGGAVYAEGLLKRRKYINI